MPEYSEQDLKYAAQLRDEIHREALAIAKRKYPKINSVADSHPVEDYFQQQWDYPGKWNTVVAIPDGYKSRKAFVEALVEKTIENYLSQNGASAEEDFFSLIADYPDCGADYFVFDSDEENSAFQSHKNALLKAAEQLKKDGWQIYIDDKNFTAKSISAEELFADEVQSGELNYKNAFLNPPHKNSYNTADFEKINAVLFPNGRDCLEVFKWETDWSDYFDDGKEWWGTLCLTVYDKKSHRFVIILASETD